MGHSLTVGSLSGTVQKPTEGSHGTSLSEMNRRSLASRQPGQFHVRSQSTRDLHWAGRILTTMLRSSFGVKMGAEYFPDASAAGVACVRHTVQIAQSNACLVKAPSSHLACYRRSRRWVDTKSANARGSCRPCIRSRHPTRGFGRGVQPAWRVAVGSRPR